MPTIVPFRLLLHVLLMLTVALSAGCSGKKLENNLPDSMPVVSVSGDVKFKEGSSGYGEPVSNVPITITLDHDYYQPLSIHYWTKDLGGHPAHDDVNYQRKVYDDTHATEYYDYQPQSAVVVFQPGETTKTIYVAVTPDDSWEQDETFEVHFSNLNAPSAVIKPITMTVINDDNVRVTLNGERIKEGSDQTLRDEVVAHVFLDGLPKGDVKVHWVTQDLVEDTIAQATPGVDYISSSGTLILDANNLEREIVVKINGDTAFERDEKFAVVVTGISVQGSDAGLLIGGKLTGRPVILNDEVGPLSDTGQNKCIVTRALPSGGVEYVLDACAGAVLAGQDGAHAGATMQFQNLSADCAMDKVTGLVWERKGPVNVGVRYFYALGQVSAYVAGINAQVRCGYSDWRLPTPQELASLLHFGKDAPRIDDGSFAETSSDIYWAGSSTAGPEWMVNFGTGEIMAASANSAYLRLVRGNLPAPLNAASRIVDNQNGTFSDTLTGLMWKRCYEGQIWDDLHQVCIGNPQAMDWPAALASATTTDDMGYPSDWRLPNIKDLLSLELMTVQDVSDMDLNWAYCTASNSGGEIWSSTPFFEKQTDVVIEPRVWTLYCKVAATQTTPAQLQTKQVGQGQKRFVRLVRGNE